MSPPCPACGHQRQHPRHGQDHDRTPAWQCPACKVSYVKAAALAQAVHRARCAHAHASSLPVQPGHLARAGWSLAAGLLVCAGIWTAQTLVKRGAQIQQQALDNLRHRVQPADIRLYSASRSPASLQARAWLDSHGLPYVECDTEQSSRCADELHARGGHGVPYLVVHGNEMPGFNSMRLVALLQQR